MRRIILPLLAVLALLLVAQPAQAHAIVVRTEPADGAVLDTAPARIELWFSEPIALQLGQFELTDGAGRALAARAVRGDATALATAMRGGQAAAMRVTLELPTLRPGVYRLRWRVPAGADLHITSGMLVFGLQQPVDTAGAAAATLPAPVEVGLRWLSLGALAGLLGALALLGLLPYALHDPQVTIAALEQVALLRRRLLALAEWAALAAFLANLALLLHQALGIAGAAPLRALVAIWSILSTTTFGWAWSGGQLGLLALGLLLARQHPAYSRRPAARSSTSHSVRPWLRHKGSAGDEPRPSLFRALRGCMKRIAPRFAPGFYHAALALLVVGAHACQGHAATGTLAQTTAAALHLAGAGVWAGGLAALVLVVLPIVWVNRTLYPLGLALLRGFGGPAAAGVALLTISGLLLLGQQVASIDALLTTLYGRTLLLKLALALLALLLGLGNAARLHGWLGAWLARLGWPLSTRPPAPGRIRLELLGGLAILLCAALLGATPPARGPEFAPPAAQPTLSRLADDLLITAALKPNRPGQNFIALGVFDTRRPAPAGIRQVAVRLHAPGGAPSGELVAGTLGAGRYELRTDAVTSAGSWRIEVIVRRAGMPDTATSLDWVVLPAGPTRPPLVSASPLEPWARGLALALLLALPLLPLAAHSPGTQREVGDVQAKPS